jgi:hypothetical protein
VVLVGVKINSSLLAKVGIIGAPNILKIISQYALSLTFDVTTGAMSSIIKLLKTD